MCNDMKDKTLLHLTSFFVLKNPVNPNSKKKGTPQYMVPSNIPKIGKSLFFARF
jgi:hypothetical protein